MTIYDLSHGGLADIAEGESSGKLMSDAYAMMSEAARAPGCSTDPVAKRPRVRYHLLAAAPIASVALAQSVRYTLVLADGTTVRNIHDAQFHDDDDEEDKHLHSFDSKGREALLNIQSVTAPEGELLDRRARTVVLSGVILQASNVHGEVTVWTVLFDKLDSLIMMGAMLFLVLICLMAYTWKEIDRNNETATRISDQVCFTPSPPLPHAYFCRSDNAFSLFSRRSKCSRCSCSRWSYCFVYIAITA